MAGIYDPITWKKQPTVQRMIDEIITRLNGLVEGNITLAEFGISIVNVSQDGTYPVDPPTPRPGDTSVLGYAWLVATNPEAPEDEHVYDLVIWTQIDQQGTVQWENFGQFPVPGPQGEQGIQGEIGPRGRDALIYNGIATGIEDPLNGRSIMVDLSQLSHPPIQDEIIFTLYRNRNVTPQMMWIVVGTIANPAWSTTSALVRITSAARITGEKGDTGAMGPQGLPGLNGSDGINGQNGADGITPSIDPNSLNWLIGDTDTGVKAKGEDGHTLRIHTGIYTVATLPAFDTTTEGDAYVVDDSAGYYDLYFHGVGGTEWSIMNDAWGVPIAPENAGLGVRNYNVIASDNPRYTVVDDQNPDITRPFFITSSTMNDWITSGNISVFGNNYIMYSNVGTGGIPAPIAANNPLRVAPGVPVLCKIESNYCVMVSMTKDASMLSIRNFSNDRTNCLIKTANYTGPGNALQPVFNPSTKQFLSSDANGPVYGPINYADIQGTPPVPQVDSLYSHFITVGGTISGNAHYGSFELISTQSAPFNIQTLTAELIRRGIQENSSVAKRISVYDKNTSGNSSYGYITVTITGVLVFGSGAGSTTASLLTLETYTPTLISANIAVQGGSSSGITLQDVQTYLDQQGYVKGGTV